MTTTLPSEAEARHPRRWLVLLVSTLAFTALCALGTWQVERLQWKEALLASIAERTAAQPQPLAAIETRFRDSGDVEYWPVSATGTFDHAKERHFFATWQGQTGYYVYTPLMLDDGRAVLVNRGFVPFELKESGKRPQGLISGRVTITGLARNPLGEKPSWIVPDNDLAKDIFYWKDRDRMAESAGLPTGDRLLPFFIDAGPGAAPGGWPVGGVTLIDLPNNHLQYAVTWYGLAAALGGVVAVWLFRARRAP